MKLTKKLEAEILKAYNECWKAYLAGDLKTYASFLSDQFKFIGTSEGEQFDSKKDWISYCKKTIKQFAGVIQKKTRDIKVVPIGEGAIVTENSDLYVLIDDKWIFYSKMRISAVLQKEKGGWKYVHQHGSLPDARANEGEVIASAQIKKENLQLREAVKRRTAELENKNRELEIESALERVRAIALSIKQPADMIEICRIISQQLSLLGIKEIRNVQTAIFYDKGTYMNYEYYAKHKKTIITEVDYTGPKVHKDQKKFAQTMMSSDGSIYTKSFKGQKLKDWYAYQKTTNQLADKFLLTAPSLNYYWYSLGPVALGISTYYPLTKGEIELFLRFKNVFDLAYRRYLDIETAEAQAREAQIEAALERVRAQAMAMHKPDELLRICEVMHNELKSLGFDEIRNAMIHTFDKKDKFFLDYDFSGTAGGKISQLPTKGFAQLEYYFKEIKKSADTFLEMVLTGERLKSWKKDRKTTQQLEDPRIKSLKALYYYYYSIGTGAIGISTFSSISKEKRQILERFRNVFQLSYQRYHDIEQAEAQAREARIEAALEKVRSRSLAMHKSDELREVAGVVFQRLSELGFGMKYGAAIILEFQQGSKDHIQWITDPGQSYPQPFRIPFSDHVIVTDLFDAREKGLAFFGRLFPYKEKKEYFRHLFRQEDFRQIPDKVKKLILESKNYGYSVAFENNSAILIPTQNGKLVSDDEREILIRFAKVFEQSYVRFLDLQKAEAQAREAQIETALERVRSKAMAMHTSEQLKDVVLELRNQMGTMGQPELEVCAIHLYDESPDYFESWAAIPALGKQGQTMQVQVKFPKRGVKIVDEMMKHYHAGDKDYVMVNHGKKALEWLDQIKEKVPQAYDLIKQNLKNTTAYWSMADFKGGSLVMTTYVPPNDDVRKILRRFANVFGMAYQRFADLRQAEAQAREGQIQLALERVRARTMAMQHSDELKKVIGLIYIELGKLNVELVRCIIFTYESKNYDGYWWMANSEDPESPSKVFIKHIDLPPNKAFVREWKAKKSRFIYVMEGEVKKEWDRRMLTETELSNLPEEVKKGMGEPRRLYVNGAFNNFGGLSLVSVEPIAEENFDILVRFSKVFEQSYTRFLDIQKAEAQAREGQIQLALERVRARTMAMQRSDELSEVATVLFQQVKGLGVPQWACGFSIFEIDDKECTWYPGSPDGNILQPCKIPLTEHPVFISYVESRKRGDELFVYEKEGEYQAEHYRYMMTLPGMRELLQYMLDSGFSIPGFQIDHIANFSHGNLLFITYQHFPEMHDIFKRFAKVFDLTYARFLDLQKAEAQAREAQIQLALERVRARTMAMQRSEDLNEAASLLFQQVQSLGAPSWTAGYCIFDEDKRAMTLWVCGPWGDIQPPFRAPLDENPSFINYLEAYNEGLELYIEENSAKVNEENYQYLLTLPVVSERLNAIIAKGLPLPTYQVDHCAYFSKGFLLFITYQKVPELHDIFKRFAAVFDQTYTRFLDLQKAEAQAREAQIQLALERVRARTMAMQRSDELKEITHEMRVQLASLGTPDLETCAINLYDEHTDDIEGWAAVRPPHSPNDIIEFNFQLPKKGIYLIEDMIRAYASGVEEYSFVLTGEKGVQWMQTMERLVPDMFLAAAITPEFKNTGDIQAWFSVQYFSGGSLIMITMTPAPDESRLLIKRFAKVFGLAYRRFADLKKAEAQTREAQIQLALERVRARTMAMHNSEDVTSATATMFDEFKKLGLDAYRFGVVNIHYNRTFDVFGVTDLPSVKMSGFGLFGMDEHPIWQRWFDSWLNKEEVFIAFIAGQEKEEYFDVINRHSNYLPQQIVNFPDSFFQAYHFEEGAVWAYSAKEHSEAEKDIMKRFARGFSLTFRRYQDLRKAEAQAREAKIEAALEKVRSRSLAMHKSDELQEVVTNVFERLKELEIEMDTSSIIVPAKNENEIEYWFTNVEGYVTGFKLPFFDNSIANDLFNARKKRLELHSKSYLFEEKNEFWNYLIRHSDFKRLPASRKKFIIDSEAFTISLAFSKNTGIQINRYYNKPFSEEENEILKRFGRVFEQAYTRFLDLQKAEEQAREAQIQLALERVRARTMAMHKSEELSETAQVVFQQLNELGAIPDRISIGIADEPNGMVNFWSTDQLGSNINYSFKARLDERTVMAKTYRGWKDHMKSIVIDLQGEELEEWIRYAREEIRIPVKDELIKGRRVHHSAYFSHGWILVTTHEPQSAETIQILERFASVFDLTYRRFLDLQKAEMQAREAQIEAALERVRSRTMAMHQSEEIADIVGKIFGELKQLDLVLNRVLIWIFNNEEKYITWWSANPEAEGAESYRIDYNDQPVFLEYLQAWQNRMPLHQYTLSGETKKKWEDHLFTNTGLSKLPLAVQKGMREEGAIFTTSTISDYGLMMVGGYEPLSEGNTDIIQRFGRVFQQSYTRYLDVQKAEAQAMEARIEAALEKVRSRSLAMHKSEELQEVVHTLIGRLRELNVELYTTIIIIFTDDSKDIVWWLENTMNDQFPQILLRYADVPYLEDLFEARENGMELFSKCYAGKEKYELFKYLFNDTDLRQTPEAQKQFLFENEFATIAIAFAKKTAIHITSYSKKNFSEQETDILKRFAKVFDQSYTRFLDLQKAEAQAREAQIEASLERVRAKAMAMHKSEDLKPAVATVFEELDKLNMGLMRCGIAILDKELPRGDIWITTKSEEGNVLEVSGDEPLDNHPLLKGAYDAWLRSEDYSYVLEDQDLLDYYESLTPVKFQVPITSSFNRKDAKQYYYNAVFRDGSLFAFLDAPFNDETKTVMKRFANVFDLTYKRFLDLQKAEAQAKEAKIEASLERVRAKTMAMQNSDDVVSATSVLFEELDKLGIKTMRCGVLLFKENQTMEVWTSAFTNDGHVTKIIGNLDMTIHPLLQGVFKSWKNKDDFYSYKLVGEDIHKYYSTISKAYNPYSALAHDSSMADHYCSIYYFEEGSLYTFSIDEPIEETKQILKKFTAVFSLTFRRYQDLKKAEAQAREAKVETGLERVRAMTMAMHSSEDVSLATATMLSEWEKLGIENFRGGILNIRENETMEVWSINTLDDGSIARAIGDFDMRMHPFWQQLYKGWKNKDDYAYFPMIGKDKEDYIRILDARRDYLPNGLQHLPDSHVQSYFFDEGAVWAFSPRPHTEENKQVMKRFAAVFSLTFRRYQDLKNAEAQAREARIEASLEKVRSKAMAMHNSQDLADTIGVFYRELHSYSLTPRRCGVGLLEKKNRNCELFTWNTTEAGESLELVGRMKMEGHPILVNIYEHWLTQTEYHPVLRGNEIKEYYQVIRPQIAFPDYAKDAVQFGYFFYFKEGGVYAWTEKELSEDELQIYRRFTSVLSLTYKRYNDLRIAEANAREARIEAAMEKVRARAMAMQKPGELVEVAELLRKEMGLLGVEELETSSIYIHDETTGITECWYAIQDVRDGDRKLVSDHMTMNLSESWVGKEMLRFYKSAEKQTSIVMKGEHRKEWINYCSQQSKILKGYYGDTIPDRTYHLFKFSNGYMGAASPGELSAESWELLKRATTVFSLAYTRFADLQLAEANAKEAVKQAALDRVRAEIASMRSVEDLERITPLIWNELTILGIPFIRCGVFIMDEAQQTIHTFLSTPDGKAIAAFHLPYSTPGNLGLVLKHWHEKKIYVDHWDEASFVEIAKILMQQGSITSEGQYLRSLPHGGFYLHFLPFLQGMLYAGNTTQLGDDDIKLIQHVADAFSTAYARYEDFNKLEAAKLQVEQTLTDLKQAQTQLVQSEKMASLGELTAGIAHEIQNPLNFVNNFSDVSNELLQEMKEQLAIGNRQQAIELAEDVKQNLEKILHHGKRADAIVKGMLQHSRASSGQKELTDINLLADEYLRLAYHGLRAKDKSFNAKFETDFDAAIEKVNVVPQEIGRVILNLINNAFYAVNEKKKNASTGSAGHSYEPIVTITTRKNNGKISISVADNGIGIPQKSLDKIFQPFFTTKPTSQGTGLGLSLAYDIVTKGHGGELKVETKEGEGSEFVVSLPG